jgi:hypothetical protein
MIRGFKRQDSKSISAARENAGSRLSTSPAKVPDFHLLLPVTFQNIHLRRLIKGTEVNVPESITEWLDEHPRIALDAEGIPLVLHIPQWQSRSSLVCEFVSLFNELIKSITTGHLRSNMSPAGGRYTPLNRGWSRQKLQKSCQQLPL